MNVIEIRQRKKAWWVFFGCAIFIMLLTTGGIFFDDKYKDATGTKVSLMVGLVLFVCMIYYPMKNLIKNQPIIILTEDAIVLQMTKPVVIQKKDIRGIDIEYVEDKGYFLNIKTEDKTHQEGISWLDKTPDEIKELIKKYRVDPGSI